MDSKDFKKQFGDIAKANNFKASFGGWYKENDECIFLCWLQKSSYANEFYLNLRVYIQGAFNRRYIVNKELMKSSFGHVIYQITGNPAFDLADMSFSDDKRKVNMEKLFVDFLIPFSERCLSKVEIVKMFKEQKIYLTPAVQKELGFTTLLSQ